MCGIAGQVNSDGKAQDALLLEMCRALVHRGPDSRGVHTSRGAGLGIQRLRVIDVSTGDQPIFNEDRSVVVVLNGEIYNFRELRRDLERAGHRFSTGSDTEVIVHLYEEHGPRCAERLHGMFAFALWDERRRQLMLARDRLGKKPLFYSHRGGTLTFASELNALMVDPEIPRELDHRALDHYFAYRYIPAPMSVFRAVRKLPPATVLLYRDGEIAFQRYWRLDFASKRPVADVADLHEEIRDSIKRAVRRRMISDVPLGAFLSGGIDSSAVVAAMAEASPEPVRTFSIGFPSDDFNELPHARQIARQFATDHHEFVVEPRALDIVDTVARQYGEPFADASAIPSFYLSELARRHVTVALNGDGGDENFGGYQRYVSNLLLERLRRLPRPLRGAAAAAGGLLPSSPRINSSLSRARRLARALPMDAAGGYAAYMSYLDGLDRGRLYTDEYRELVRYSRPEEMIEQHWRESTGASVIDVMMDVDIATYLPGDLLVKMDIATMAHSLEARSPLLDHELMELTAAIPASLKVRGREKKVLLRDALLGHLPDGILDRPKRGFELPLAEWFRGELKDLARDSLLDPIARERGWFRQDYVKGLLERHFEGREDNSRRLWTLLMFELWHRQVSDERRDPLTLEPSSAG